MIPGFATDEKLVPLDDLFEKYADDYDLDAISESMRTGMSYDGNLYAMPMQAQMFVMAYRADVFEDLGLEVPTTFPRDDRGGRGDQGGGTHGVPDRPAVARDGRRGDTASRRR